MQTISKLGKCRIPGWSVGLAAVAAVLLFAGASDALAQSLNGVSCTDVETNGIAANDPSDRGFTNPLIGSPIALPARSGFDYLGAYVWVTNSGGACASELDDLYLCLSVAGRWGDADGDGVRDAQGGLCGTAINPGSDGPLGELPLSRNEALTFFIDRDCDGTPDLQLEVAGAVGGSPSLKVTADDYTGLIGTDLGGEGVAFEYSDKSNTAYVTCEDDILTKVLVRVADWDQFFDAPGLSAAIFSYDINGGNRVDGPPEDNVRGDVDIVAPDLKITKGPNLALCEGQQGNVTISVENTGNVKVSNIVVTDELPVGWTSCGVVSGGVTVEQVGTTLTFSSFDLDPCEKKDIVLCLEAGALCTDGLNTASAEGVHLAVCLDGGGRGVGPVEASSLLECLVGPCIDIRCAVDPLEVCPGDKYTVSVWGKNCSSAPEDITLYIDGESKLFADVAAGAEVRFDWDFTASGDCPPGEKINHLTRAVATNECDDDPGVEKTCPVSVTCLAEPCVTVRCETPSEPQPVGSPVKVIGYATNCSNGVEDIKLCIDRPDDAVEAECQVFEDVPSGETVMFMVEYECDTEAFKVEISAIAANGCGEVEAPENAVCEVTCFEGENCPRTPGFWTQQCAQKGNGSTKFTKSEVDKIAACVNDMSAFFDWADAFGGFCYAINPDRPMNQHKQLQRHFAALLANYCTGDLGLIANNGNTISLDLGTKINCEGTDADTIGELIKEIDDALINDKTDKYGALLYCADAINNGDNIPVAADCNDYETPDPSREVSLDPTSFRLDNPYPNPFRHDVVLSYSVPSGDNQRVDIGVYNVAGRLVRNLVSGSQGAGQYQINWNGLDNGGSRVQRGVYFVRARLNGQPVGNPTRVLKMD